MLLYYLKFFTSWATREAKNTGVGNPSLLQGIFTTQELNWGLLHCRWILYQLSYEESHSSGEGNSNPLQYSCLENSMDRQGSLGSYSPWGSKESDTTERLTVSPPVYKFYAISIKIARILKETKFDMILSLWKYSRVNIWERKEVKSLSHVQLFVTT